MVDEKDSSFVGNAVVLVFGALFLLSVILLISTGPKTTGYATETSTISNVTISSYFAIDMSVNLTDGIQFGTISALPATNQNATHNYDGANTTDGGGTYNQSTSMWMNVSTDSNTAVDFCVKADALNTSAGDAIGLANESYSNYTATNFTVPRLAKEVGLTTSYVTAGLNTAAGSNNYYRFWLDVPAATPTGVYNNTVNFKGVATGGAC